MTYLKAFLIGLAVVTLIFGLTLAAWWLTDGSLWSVVVGSCLGTIGGVVIVATLPVGGRHDRS